MMFASSSIFNPAIDLYNHKNAVRPGRILATIQALVFARQ
jgi:hypothetical protein